MRPGQNKRMRGRNPNNNNSSNNGGSRKGPNPLTRSYESNGPDVKIRGNAHHVAEKYLQLARDAQSSGDPVAAESYLQHAEHYFRLIASAQQAQMGHSRPEEVDDNGDDDDSGIPDRFASPQPAAPFVPTPRTARRHNPTKLTASPMRGTGNPMPSARITARASDSPMRSGRTSTAIDRINRLRTATATIARSARIATVWGETDPIARMEIAVRTSGTVIDPGDAVR